MSEPYGRMMRKPATSNAIRTKWQKRLARLKEDGLCVTCHKDPARIGRTTCNSCADARSARISIGAAHRTPITPITKDEFDRRWNNLHKTSAIYGMTDRPEMGR